MSYASVAAVVFWLVFAWLWFGEDSLALIVLVTAPSFNVWVSTDPVERRRRWRGDITKLAIGAAVSFVLHSTMAEALGGTIRWGDVLITGLVFAGAIFLLDYLDRGLRRVFSGWGVKPLVSVMRMLIVLALALPGAVALLQCVRVKVGYEMPKAALDLKPVEFIIDRPGWMFIRGYFFDAGSDTTLVVAHGIGAHSENFVRNLIPHVRGGKVNGLIFDFRAHGYSGGHVSTFGAREADDMRAAVGWLKRHNARAATHLIYYGFSMGSAAAVRAAVDEPNLRGLIIDSGFAKLTDVARALSMNLPTMLRGYIYHTAMPMACALTGTNLYAIEPAKDIAKLSVPVKVMHGGADAMIPPEQGKRLAEAARTTARIVPGAGHVDLGSSDPAYGGDVGRFIDLILADIRPRADPGESIGPSIGAPPSRAD